MTRSPGIYSPIDAGRIDAADLGALERAAMTVKYQNGIPFCIGTTMVSGPKSFGTSAATAST